MGQRSPRGARKSESKFRATAMEICFALRMKPRLPKLRRWQLAALRAAAASLVVSVQTPPEEILPKDYKPRSIFKIPETRVEKAHYAVIDVHSHDYASTAEAVDRRDEHFYPAYFLEYHWPMHAWALPDEVLRKIYRENAVKLLATGPERNYRP